MKKRGFRRTRVPVSGAFSNTGENKILPPNSIVEIIAVHNAGLQVEVKPLEVNFGRIVMHPAELCSMTEDEQELIRMLYY